MAPELPSDEPADEPKGGDFRIKHFAGSTHYGTCAYFVYYAATALHLLLCLQTTAQLIQGLTITGKMQNTREWHLSLPEQHC